MLPDNNKAVFVRGELFMLENYTRCKHCNRKKKLILSARTEFSEGTGVRNRKEPITGQWESTCGPRIKEHDHSTVVEHCMLFDHF